MGADELCSATPIAGGLEPSQGSNHKRKHDLQFLVMFKPLLDFFSRGGKGQTSAPAPAPQVVQTH